MLASYYPALPSSFARDVEATAARLGLHPGWLMAVMDFETGGTFSPSVRNPHSGFTGLIQFGPAAAAELGTSLAALARMTRSEQLRYVESYFDRRIRERGPLSSLEDTYMAVLYPAAIGRPKSYVLFAYPSTAYLQNSGLDASGDGTVTKAEAAAPVRARLKAGGGGPLLAGLGGSPVAGVVLLSIGLAAAASIVTRAS